MFSLPPGHERVQNQHLQQFQLYLQSTWLRRNYQTQWRSRCGLSGRSSCLFSGFRCLWGTSNCHWQGGLCCAPKLEHFQKPLSVSWTWPCKQDTEYKPDPKMLPPSLSLSLIYTDWSEMVKLSCGLMCQNVEFFVCCILWAIEKRNHQAFLSVHNAKAIQVLEQHVQPSRWCLFQGSSCLIHQDNARPKFTVLQLHETMVQESGS